MCARWLFSEQTHPLIGRLLAGAALLEPPVYLTLTAIHPTRCCAVPSRHIAVHNRDALRDARQRLQQANRSGWGAYVGIGYRVPGLGRYRRGGKTDIRALPALFADVDRPPAAVRPYLDRVPEPGLMLASGAGTHLYWFLRKPTLELQRAGRILTGLAQWLKADSTMTVDQIMRLPGTRNTKPGRSGAHCRVLQQSATCYTLDDFFPYEILSTSPTGRPSRRPSRQQGRRRGHASSQRLNPRLTAAVRRELETHFAATPRPDGWLACHCPFPHQQDRYPGDHAFFRPDIGLFHCFGKHGRYLLKDLAAHLGLSVRAYGGIYLSN
jgi:hypothetical protein